jgi:uncharacterized membrane protein YsdA (DUF1294 family)
LISASPFSDSFIVRPFGGAIGPSTVQAFLKHRGLWGEVPYALAPLAFALFLTVNAWTIFRFWQDKWRAQAGERRIPESDLLALALVGGSPGALLARRLFRHKTRKQPFSTRLQLICALQLGALLGLAFASAKRLR